MNRNILKSERPQGEWASRPHQRVGTGVRFVSASPVRDTRDLFALSIENRHRSPDTTANESKPNIQHPSSKILTLRPSSPDSKIAGTVWRLGRYLSFIAVLGVLGLSNVFAQNMGDTLTWNGSTAAGASWATGTAGSWYDKTTSTGVTLNSAGNIKKT